MSDTSSPKFLISFDEGNTWRAMPNTWQQDGRIVEGPDGVAVQTVGRGRTIWYKLMPRDIGEYVPDRIRSRGKPPA